MDDKSYQLLLDDLGELVEAYGLPLAEMMNQSPREVLRACIDAAWTERAERRRLEDELERLTQFTAGCVAVGGKQITELEELRAIVGLANPKNP